MPTFHYLALDAAGRELRGSSEARSESALEEVLRRQGRWLVEVRTSTAVRVRGTIVNRPVKRRVLIEFFLQLGMQLKAGIPIVSALSHGSREATTPTFAAIQRQVLDSVKTGVPLSEALSRHPKTFEPLIVNLVKAAESSGQLAEACHQIREHLEWCDRLVGEVRRALLYPTCVLFAAGAFVILMFSFVVPKFAALFTQMQLELPAVTVTVMGLSGFVLRHGIWILLVLLLGVVFWFGAPGRVPGFRRWRDAFKLRLPLFGDVLRLICVARFTRNLSVVFGAGVPLLEALRLCRELAGNDVLAGAVGEVAAGVREGRKMNETMSGHDIFSPLVVRMVEVGEGSGTLTEALGNVADYHDEHLSRIIKKRLALLEPILIVLLVGVVGVVALALVLPIAELMSFT